MINNTASILGWQYEVVSSQGNKICKLQINTKIKKDQGLTDWPSIVEFHCILDHAKQNVPVHLLSYHNKFQLFFSPYLLVHRMHPKIMPTERLTNKKYELYTDKKKLFDSDLRHTNLSVIDFGTCSDLSKAFRSDSMPFVEIFDARRCKASSKSYPKSALIAIAVCLVTLRKLNDKMIIFF